MNDQCTTTQTAPNHRALAATWAATATDADLTHAAYIYYVGAYDPQGEASRDAARFELAARTRLAYANAPKVAAAPRVEYAGYRASDRSSD